MVGAVVAGTLCVVLVDAAVVWLRIERADGELPGSAPGGTTYLVLGSDSRAEVPASVRARFGTTRDVAGERADVALLVRVSDDGSVRALGVPRDLVTYRPGQGPERLTLQLAHGPVAVAQALCHSLGVGIDHVAMLRFDGVRDLVDLVGGITVTSDAVRADRNSGLLLEDGVNHLDGDRAIAYVRARHVEVLRDGELVPDPAEDARRPERAMEVMRALGRKLDVDWTDPWRMQRLAWTASGAVAVGGGTGPFDLLHLADAVRGLGADVPVLPVRQIATDPVPIQEVGAGAREVIGTLNGPGDQPDECSRPAVLPPGQ